MMIEELVRTSDLVVMKDFGVAYCDPAGREVPYDRGYFQEYEERAANDVSDALMEVRHRMVIDRWVGDVVDYGIGAGAFVLHRLGKGFPTLGFDVNPWGVHWLVERDLFWDPGGERPGAMTFWDVLEHVVDPRPILAKIEKWVFVSLPLYEDLRDVRSSKHYKPGEHVWYWTHDGLVRFLLEQGFSLVEFNRCEEEVGREGIGSFAFQRFDEGGWTEPDR